MNKDQVKGRAEEANGQVDFNVAHTRCAKQTN